MNEEKNALKWPMAVVGIIVLAIVLVMCWWQSTNVTPVVKIPTPTMPKPNGYDYFAAAGKLLREKKKIGYAASEERAPGYVSDGPDDREYSLAEKENLVKLNAPVLKMVRQGLKYDCRAHPSRSFDTVFPELGVCRTAARLLKLEADTKIARGDWNGAMNSYLDGMEMGSGITRGGGLIHGLVGCAIHSIERKDAWNAVDHLDAQDARLAATRLERIHGSFAPVSETLEEEKWSSTAGLLEILRRPGWRTVICCLGSTGSSQGLDSLRSLTFSKRKIVYIYMRYMDEVVASSRKAYPAMKPPALPTVPGLELIAPLYDGTVSSFVINDSLDSLLLVSLALRAYKLDHGSYPKTLDALVPAYLERLPSDQFAMNGAFRYKPAGGKYLLYSIGPDGKDDGGKPICDASKPANGRYYVMSNSKGDIVAGVNR